MLFADDSALIAHEAESMQLLVNRFSLTAKQFSLKINIKKTECLFQPIKNQHVAPSPGDIIVHDKALLQRTLFILEPQYLMWPG